jgi:hypothetical protein
MRYLDEEEEDGHVGEDHQPDVGLDGLDLGAGHQPGADGHLYTARIFLKNCLM